ncbi:hypothetical protein [Streptomyces sp. PA5.6]|uniref:hypothetical protein n=1 Tax=Streptomyces sp. PA5.6 TaxID=3035651 RepID=UPI003904C89D
MTADGTGELLAHCDECTYLVPVAALRISAPDAFTSDADDDDEITYESNLRCFDTVACRVRQWLITGNPETAPVYVVISLKAALFRCMNCDAARRSDEIAVLGEMSGEELLISMVCKDQEACGTYASQNDPTAVRERLRETLDEENGENT